MPADLPKHYRLDFAPYEGNDEDGWTHRWEWYADGSTTFYDSDSDAAAGAESHRAAVVESSPEVAALRRERDELRATVARVDEALRDIEVTQRIYERSLLTDHARGYAEARRLLADFIRKALNPTGDDHG